METMTPLTHETLSQRLQVLRQELARGEAQLENLERQRERTRETLLRISGAIQVLEELLEQHPAPASLFPETTREAGGGFPREASGGLRSESPRQGPEAGPAAVLNVPRPATAP